MSTNNHEENEQDDDQLVTPWKVITKGQFNYEKLQNQFGLKPITPELITKLEEVTGRKPSHFLTREIFFAHQDFDKILEDKNNGKEIFIYTGRGPSRDHMHIAHLLPLVFTVEMQKALDCWAVVEISDEEKFIFKDGTLDEFMGYTESNAKDLIACGFNPEKTFIFSSFKYERYMRHLVTPINKIMSVHVSNKIYGFNDQSNVAQLSWPAYEIAPTLSGAFPHIFGDRKLRCLVLCAVDQAPYFRIARDIAKLFDHPKPALLCSKFLVGLQGTGEKASSTGQVPPIFLNETPKEVANKIKRFAFSGGQETKIDHRKYGANLSVDVPYIYLYHFMKDEERLKQIAKDYSTGKMLTGEIKQIVTDVINNMLKEHQDERAKITPEIYEKYFTMRVQPDCKDYFVNHCKKYLDIPVIFE